MFSQFNFLICSKPIYELQRLSNMFKLSLSFKNTFESLCLDLADSRVIYGIFTLDKIYIGVTNCFDTRRKTHFNNIRKLVCLTGMNSSSVCCKSSSYSKLYRMVARCPVFKIIPLIRIATLDAIHLEKYLIRTLNTCVMNSDKDNSFSKSTLPNLISSTSLDKSKKTSDKKKRRCNKAPKNPSYHEYKSQIAPSLFFCKNICYTSLLSIFNTFTQKSISITVHPGKSLSPWLSIIKFSFVSSPVFFRNKEMSLNNFLKNVFLSHTEPFSFSVTIRSNTLTEEIFLLIKSNQTPNRINVLISSFTDKMSTNINGIFWLHLFKIAHKHNNAKNTQLIRRFLKNYIYVSYKLSSTEIHLGLSVNITVNYSPWIDSHSLSTAHKALILCFSHRPTFIQSTYTTLKKHKPLSSIVFNHRDFISKFSPNMKPKCSCNCSSNDWEKHELILPFEMPLDEENSLRNLDTPISDKPFISLLSITHKFLVVINKLNKLLQCNHDTLTITTSIDSYVFFTLIKTKQTTSVHMCFLNIFLVLLSLVSNLYYVETTQIILEYIDFTVKEQVLKSAFIAILKEKKAKVSLDYNTETIYNYLINILYRNNNNPTYDFSLPILNILTHNELALNLILYHNMKLAPHFSAHIHNFLIFFNQSALESPVACYFHQALDKSHQLW